MNMFKKYIYLTIFGLSVLLIGTGILYLVRFNPKNLSGDLTSSDIKTLYGWSIEPRDERPKTDYIFSLHKIDSLNYNSKPTNFYIIHNLTEISLPNGISYDSFKEVLGLEDSIDVKVHLDKLHKIFLSTGATRIISDLQNPNVVYFTFGKRLRTLLVYIPKELDNKVANKITSNYKKINHFWYYKREL
jgi:hypothetical protein